MEEPKKKETLNLKRIYLEENLRRKESLGK